MTRERRDCRCLRARHEHGTFRAYQYDECRCAPCLQANATRLRDYRLACARRRWDGSSAWTDSTGTRRRLQALAAAGWSLTELAVHLEMGASGVGWLRKTEGRCLAATAEKVSTVYEQLWHLTPTGAAVERTARWAERRGWAAPWAWEGVDIDDPAATSHLGFDDVDEIAVAEAMAGRAVSLTRAERAEVVRLMTEAGHSASAIAECIGTTSRTVTRDRAAA